MAEALYNRLCRRDGVPDGAFSCGIAAPEGAPASEYARQAAAELGGDLSLHRARQADRALLSGAEKIYTMTGRHAAALRQAFPELADRVEPILPPVPDPYGGSAEDYRRTAAALDVFVRRIYREAKV